jgi:hypothetical protein
MVVGALMSIGGGILESGAKEAAELMKFKLEVVSKELEKSYKSFQQATAAGALFAGGMTELRNVGLKAGLTQEQFSKVIADNSQALASFGGSVADGGKKLGLVVKSFGAGTQRELLNLGITVEDQAQGVADYMSILQRGGELRYKQDAEIAQGAKDYMISLKAIAAFTGEDAKKAEQRAKEAAQQGAVDQKLREMGGEANVKFQNLVKQLGPGSEKVAQQMLLFGKILDPELAMVFGPKMVEQVSSGIEDVKNGAITNNAMIENAQQFARENQQRLLAEAGNAQKIFGTVAMATGQYANQSLIASQRATVYNRNFDEVTQSTLQDAKDASTTQDDLTQGVTKSIEELQKMKVALQNDLTPSIKNFALEIPIILEGFREKMRKLGLLTDLTRESEKTAATATANNVVASSDSLRTSIGMAPTTVTPEETAALERATAQFNTSLTGKLSNWIMSWGKKEEPKPNAQSPEIVGPMANGGIASGPRSGYLANLHGTEAVVPLPNGRSIPIDMSGMVDSLKSLFVKDDGGTNDDFKRQVLENNNLMIAALRQMQEIYTKSMETTKLVSSTIAADSETSAALLEAMNAVVGVLEDSKYELQDQSSSLKKLYDVTA